MNQQSTDVQPTDVQVVAHLERLVKSGRMPRLSDGTLQVTHLQRVLALRGMAVGKTRLSGLIDLLGVRRVRNRAVDVASFEEMVRNGHFTEFMNQQHESAHEIPALVE